MSRTSTLLIGMLGWAVLRAVPAAGGNPTAPRPEPAQVEFFEKSVRPVLADKCLGCHGPEKQKGGLRLDSRASMMKGGESGPAIMPGDPEQSRLIEAIRYGDDLQMPPKAKLKEPEIAALTRWVKQGAVWAEAGAETPAPTIAARVTITDEDRAFWSFRPISSPAIPAVRQSSWPRSPVDRFVLARLEQEGLRPVAQADKRTLIRRATFDLTGLPPTADEIDAFLADGAPEAFGRVVDRLLASPHYGERWGRHWLDVARYGEDQAHTFQARLYPCGYRYRDWVVRALNDDMPYDRFVTEQIAGDLIDGPGHEARLAALGYFALGPVYYGKAVFDELDDRVDTLCRGFLGLTVSCARCHDHKFDPIPQRDYYSLAGVFASTDYKEYPHVPADVVARYEKAQTEIQDRTAALTKFVREQGPRISDRLAGDSARYMVAAWTLANQRKLDPSIKTSAVARKEGLEEFLLDRWVKYLAPRDRGTRPYLARWHKVLDAQDPKADLSADETERSRVAETARAFENYLRSLVKLQQALKDREVAARANGLTGTKAVALEGPDALAFAEVVSSDGILAIPREKVEDLLDPDSRAAVKARKAELARLKKEAPAKYPVTHGLTEGAAIANMRIHVRGNPETLGNEAPRRFLAILSHEAAPAFQHGSGRLELARAIASPDNPLTARVMVNRIWEHHFGRGLVGTPSNFGHLGERPTHPELLDYLAGRFIALGWSMKRLHREIMLSAVYQLGSGFDAQNQEVDPDNRLLWRMNRRRLEVEAWRDAMLAVSGKLDGSIGGPSTPLGSADNERRTLYAFVSRHNLDGLLRLFDFPDPNITSDKRVVTAVPLQQLFVLNSDFMERQAQALAARLHNDPREDNASRVRRAFVLVYGRPASEQEVRWAVEFLSGGSSPGEARTRWDEYAQVLLGTNEFAFID